MLTFTACLLATCTTPDKLEKTFGCHPVYFGKTQRVNDLYNNFSLEVPITWNRKHYFKDSYTELMVADTTRQLSESYIISSTFTRGTLNFDPAFLSQTQANFYQGGMEIVEAQPSLFNGKPAYWFLSKGQRNKRVFHQFSLLIKLSDKEFFQATTDLYGKEELSVRICESLSLLRSLRFLK
ncbi:MAG: hypothetical protein QGH06_08645 [Lutibacter sp.]|jgi:hypothetical protein|nr:hypothetical protein [Lutibacter sp.]